MIKPIVIVLLFCFSCQAEKADNNSSARKESSEKKENGPTKIETYYSQNKGNDSASISTGTYSNGKLINGKLIPFKGKNFEYFSEASYLSDRAFLNDKVLKILMETYEELETLYPGKKFYVMESSHKNGGKFFPHRTHQNGLSIDLMTPMLKDGKDYPGLDQLDIPHYWISFDANGVYSKDKSITINFNLVAHHILLLDKNARKNGMKVNRVHFKNDLHDELLSAEFGKELKKNGITLTTLSRFISEQHDDHFHVDFGKK